MNTSFIEQQIDRLTRKKESVGLTPDEYESLAEYEGYLQSMDAERSYLNGERA